MHSASSISHGPSAKLLSTADACTAPSQPRLSAIPVLSPACQNPAAEALPCESFGAAPPCTFFKKVPIPSLALPRRFMPTSRRIVQFADGVPAPPGSKVVYIDGAFDLFHPGHVLALQVSGFLLGFSLFADARWWCGACSLGPCH